MYLDEYKRWLAADLEDADLKPELVKVEGNDDEIKDRFAVALKFGTAGLRGVLGAGTNRMNIYVVRQATQGLANWVLTQGGTQTVAISYDSRLKSDVFAKTAAGVLAANGIKVRIYDALMPVPALSFATRYYNCNAGIMVTASHNPAKYNGYKAYGPDGCQMTDDAAAIVYDEIQKTDVLTGAKYISFAEGVENGMIRFVGDDCKKALYEAIEARQVRPGLCKTAGLKLVYSPLWQQQRQFLSDASHELKTPLTVILSNAELLEAAPLEDRPARWADNIRSEAGQMKSLVEEMLTLARADNAVPTAVMGEVSLSDLATDCVLAFEPVAFEAGKPLESDITPDVTVTGDADKLRQLIGVLLDNAIKYGQAGGTISLTLRRTDRQARLLVSNPGDPIPPDQLGRLFERFYRADASRGEQSGFGLGLPIAASIATEHKGTLKAESDQASTRFLFSMPLKK